MAATSSSKASTAVKTEEVSSNVDEVSSDGSSPLASREPSTTDLNGLDKKQQQTQRQEVPGSSPSQRQQQGMTLEERRKIPVSIFATVGIAFGFHYFGGLYTMECLHSVAASLRLSSSSVVEGLEYIRDLMKAVFQGQTLDHKELAFAAITCFLLGSILYVMFVAPFMAGLWTGRKATKHKVHRYLGLVYLIQYALAWVEFVAHYESAKDSFLPLTITLNGVIQGISAFRSFKVLPGLQDPGYYSDKAVLSRNFVHENIFFTLLAFCGATYYNQYTRTTLQSSIPGRILEFFFVFFPYITIRPLFPTTSFSNAGTTHKGRTEKNARFYQIGTFMVKFFYLWAKYLLGFFINYCVYLDLLTEKQWKLQHGMFLLNGGTVSIAVFLHTLRFKKILPPKLTFGIYLAQIYATFLAIPLAYDLFTSHLKLCGLCFLGVLCNMTRSKFIHGVWCFVAMLLVVFGRDKIDW